MKRNNLSFWLPVFVWCGVIFILSSISVTKISTSNFLDFILKKTAHLGEYGVLFLLLYRALVNTTSLSRVMAAFISFSLAIVYGATDEFHQIFTLGREPSLRDVVIDGAGAGFAWLGLWKLLPKAQQPLVLWAKKLGLI